MKCDDNPDVCGMPQKFVGYVGLMAILTIFLVRNVARALFVLCKPRTNKDVR
jgi:hypothetical protein